MRTLEATPARPATPAQQVMLAAAAAQLRAAASSILVSEDKARAGSVESSLAELIARTLSLVEQTLASAARSDDHRNAEVRATRAQLALAPGRPSIPKPSTPSAPGTSTAHVTRT